MLFIQDENDKYFQVIMPNKQPWYLKLISKCLLFDLNNIKHIKSKASIVELSPQDNFGIVVKEQMSIDSFKIIKIHENLKYYDMCHIKNNMSSEYIFECFYENDETIFKLK